MTGEELKQLREAQGLGQRHLAAASGVPQRDISRAENGQGFASLSRGAAEKLKKALGKGT